MAAERTPSRRKQCIFRRTLQRFPFGKCERRSRSSSSSYDVHIAEMSPAKTNEKWSPNNASIAAFNFHPTENGEGVEQAAGDGTPPSDVSVFNGGYEGDVSGLPLSPRLHLTHHHIDSMQIHPDLEKPDSDSAYSSVSYRGEQHRPVGSPPSPSISSMETDVGVDPETGERAME